MPKSTSWGKTRPSLTKEPRPLRCALLAGFDFEWASASALLCPGLEFLTLEARSLGLREAPNPFRLPEDDSADAVMVASSWYDWLEASHGERVPTVMRKLERCADVVLGFDGVDQFALGLPPHALERFAAVVKTQGLYRDRDLYNYFVGPRYPDAIWAEKRRPRGDRYRSSDLAKLRLSVPCFLADHPAVRRVSRAREPMSWRVAATRSIGEGLLDRALMFAPVGKRPLQVHCMVALTHAQRIEALRLLDGFSGERGITRVRDFIGGTEGPRVRAAGFADSIPASVRQDLAEMAKPHLTTPVGRLRYQLDLTRHQVAVAPTGYGELTYRHGEAWRAGAALVCQDVSHVEILVPMRHHENVAFCRPDLGDLKDTVEEVLADQELRQAIAGNGRRTFKDWWAKWREHLYTGIEAHVRDALGS
jgi:hypothetical protein